MLSRILDEADDLRSNPRDVQDVLATEDWARRRAREIIAQHTTQQGSSSAAGTPAGAVATSSRVGASR